MTDVRVDGELGFAVQDDEHLLHGVVEVLADPALWRQHAPVQEKQVRLEIRGGEHRAKGHLSGPAVNRLRLTLARRVVVTDTLRGGGSRANIAAADRISVSLPGSN